MRKLAAFLGYLAVSFFFLTKYPLLISDEIIYVEPAANFLEQGSFSMKFFPNIGGYERSSVIQHGRIPLWARVGLFKSFGVSVLTIRLPSFLAGACLLFLVFLIGRKILKADSAAFAVSALCAFSHPFIFSSHSARPDIFVALFVVGALYAFLTAQEKNSTPLYFLSGLIASLALDVHIPGAMACFTLLGLMIACVPGKPLPWKIYLSVGAGVAVGIGWWVGTHILLDRKLFFEQVAAIPLFSSQSGWADTLKYEWRRWHDFFWLGAYHRNMFLLFLFAPALFWILAKPKTSPDKMILGILGGGMAGYSIASPSKNSFYVIFIYPFFLMMLVHFLSSYFSSVNSIKRWTACFLSLALGGFLIMENSQKLRFYNCDYDRFMAKVKAVVPPGSVVLASLSYWPGLRGYARLSPHEMLFYKMISDAKKNSIDYFAGSNEDFYRRQGVQYVAADEEVMRGALYQKEYILPFLEKRGKVIAEFEDDFYNFSVFMSRKSPRPLVTKIYKID